MTVHRRAVALRPDDPWTHTNLGLVLMEQEHPHEALAAQRRAVAVGPSVAEIHHNLGLAFQAVSAPDAAVECFERAASSGWIPRERTPFAGTGSSVRIASRKAWPAYRRASAGAPDDARWAIAAAIALPVIPASREAIGGARARLEANLDALRRSDLRVVDPDRPGAIGPSFYLTYHGLDDRDLQRKMAGCACARIPRWPGPPRTASRHRPGRTRASGWALSRFTSTRTPSAI